MGSKRIHRQCHQKTSSFNILQGGWHRLGMESGQGAQTKVRISGLLLGRAAPFLGVTQQLQRILRAPNRHLWQIPFKNICGMAMASFEYLNLSDNFSCFTVGLAVCTWFCALRHHGGWEYRAPPCVCGGNNGIEIWEGRVFMEPASA